MLSGYLGTDILEEPGDEAFTERDIETSIEHSVKACDPSLAVKFLAWPDHALSFSEFDQIDFAQHVNRIAYLASLKPIGFCFGFLIAKATYECLGKSDDLTNDINSIYSSNTLNSDQYELLSGIQLAQNTPTMRSEINFLRQENLVTVNLKFIQTFQLTNDDQLAKNIKKMSTIIIKTTIEHFDTMIGLHIGSGLEASHIIGFMAKRENDEMIVEYSDPNYFVDVKYNRYSSAKTDIIKLLSNPYYFFYQAHWENGEDAKLTLYRLTAECNGARCQSDEARAWAQQNKHRFFTRLDQKRKHDDDLPLENQTTLQRKRFL